MAKDFSYASLNGVINAMRQSTTSPRWAMGWEGGADYNVRESNEAPELVQPWAFRAQTLNELGKDFSDTKSSMSSICEMCAHDPMLMIKSSQTICYTSKNNCEVHWARRPSAVMMSRVKAPRHGPRCGCSFSVAANEW
mmetsp:Transcript_75430/g.245369  ORF Transcript_75430/g.245369 Transcript_75430/m.245369 type:complete len:138 (+) Transcript_75430:2-415(+)